MAKTNKGRKFFATTATAALVASAIVPVASAAQVNDYNSIASYAQEAVQDLVDRGVVQGDANGNFQPRKSVSRAEAATVLSKALGLTTTDAIYFTDVKSGAWYYDAINAAVNNGVFSGKGQGKFDPNGNLTRGEAAVILVSAFNLTGKAPLAQFADEKSVKEWAKESLEIAVGNGVIKGENGRVKANDAITKQDFAVMYSRAEAAAEAVAANTVKAINNTTVEVTFADAITDIKALDFKIDGLEVKNAVVKQTDAKTAVLTTAAQVGGKEYTVTVNEESVGKFTGVAAVIPTDVKVVNRSIQGVTGKEVSVQAQVTVPEGQSKAGIPVTFYVAGSSDGLVPAITAEALTNADGVATYTYTRYVAVDDTVTAYSTGDRSKFQTGVVHWGVATQLTIEEVTTGDTIQNGANKTYKIKYVSPTTGAAVSGKSLNIAFQENIGVTADKLVTTATVNGVNPRDITGTPVVAANVVTDSKGEAVFTVTGTNAKVTPVVYEANVPTTGSVTAVGYSTTALQAKVPTVTFAAKQVENTITITGEGSKDATVGASNARKFTVDVKDKDGKVVANQVVKLSLQEQIDNVIGTSSPAYFVKFDSAGNVVSKHIPTLGNPTSVVTDSNGKATFYLASDANSDYGTPVAWIDINTSNAYANNVLEQTEPNAIGETTYFWTEKLVASKLVAKNHRTGLEVSTVTANAADGIARYEFHLTNQSGKTINNHGSYVTAINARYNINNSGAGAVAVFNNAAQAEAFRTAVNGLGTSATAQQIIALVPAGAKYISANNADFLDVNALSNALYVVSADFTKTTNVSVTASATATNVVAPGATQTYTTLVVAEAKTVTLLSPTQVGITEVGRLKAYDTTDKTFTITTAGGIDKEVSYAGDSTKTYKFVGANGLEYNAEDFIALVITNNGANVTYTNVNNVVTFKVNTYGGGIPSDLAATPTPGEDALVEANKDAKAIDRNKYNAASLANLDAAVKAAEAATTDDEKLEAAKAINEAIKNLEVKDEAKAGITFTATSSEAKLAFTGFATYNIEGTVSADKADSVAKVTVSFGAMDEDAQYNASTGTITYKEVAPITEAANNKSTVVVKAFDASGNIVVSETVTVTVK